MTMTIISIFAKLKIAFMSGKLFFTQLLCILVFAGFSQTTQEDEMFQFAETGVKLKLNEAGSEMIVDWEHFGEGSQVIHIYEYSEVNIIAIASDPETTFWIITKDNERLTPNKIEKDGMYYYGFTFISGVNTDDKPLIEWRTGPKSYRVKFFIGLKKAE
jgi:hypothetical protein